MRILNNRTLGDYVGKYTYICACIRSFFIEEYHKLFTVDDLTALSDHRPLQLQSLDTTINKYNN